MVSGQLSYLLLRKSDINMTKPWGIADSCPQQPYGCLIMISNIFTHILSMFFCAEVP